MSTAVILAGGKSTRMGRDKLALPFDGKTLLESAIARFRAEFDRVCLSVSDAGRYPEISIERLVDVLPGAGPLSGLHAALSCLRTDGVFLVAADLPFSSPLAALKIIELCGPHDACLIRLPDGKLEPLFAYYRSTLLPACADAIASGDYRMTELLSRANARYVSTGELGGLWDDRLIVNINSPEQYERWSHG